MSRPLIVSTRTVALSGRDANEVSCVFITSRAASLDEITSVGTSPMRSSITGPWRRARSRIARCGSWPARWCMLPMNGSCHGPGGSRKPWKSAGPRRRFASTTSSR
jgi:hypothetical protein